MRHITALMKRLQNSFQLTDGRWRVIKRWEIIYWNFHRLYFFQAGNFKTPIKGGRNARCFLSPPSLIASAKKERIKNEILEKVERDRLSKKLNGTQPLVIPPEKRELFTLILDEINRRIVSQSFSVRWLVSYWLHKI